MCRIAFKTQLRQFTNWPQKLNGVWQFTDDSATIRFESGFQLRTSVPHQEYRVRVVGSSFEPLSFTENIESMSWGKYYTS